MSKSKIELIADKLFIPFAKTEIDTVFMNIYHLPSRNSCYDHLLSNTFFKEKILLENHVKDYIISKTNSDILKKIDNDYKFKFLIFENDIKLMYNYWKNRYIVLLDKIAQDEKFELLYNSYDTREYRWSRDTLEDIVHKKKKMNEIFDDKLS